MNVKLLFNIRYLHYLVTNIYMYMHIFTTNIDLPLHGFVIRAKFESGLYHPNGSRPGCRVEYKSQP